MSVEFEVTQSVEYPCSDGGAVTVSELGASLLAEFGVKRVRVTRSDKKRYFYADIAPEVPLWDGQDMERGRAVPLDKFFFCALQLHKVLPGEGMIRHDGSDRFLPENFCRDAWPEPDADVVKPEVTVETSDPPELELSWLDSALLETAIRQTQKLADSEAEDIVNASVLAVTEQINAGLCKAQTPASLCAYFLATCRNKTRELVRSRRKRRETQTAIDEQFEDGPQHHIRKVAPARFEY